MRNALLLFFLLLISDYIFFSCANVKPPTGGPRDTIPPVLIQAIPENKSLNYKGNKVELIFDENLLIDNLNSKLIITPFFDSEFEYDARKNYVNIKFEKDFSDSTTYTFNFQDAIADITEKNPTLENVLAFSTGSYIDSIRVFGSIKDLLTGERLEDVTVGLYLANDTSDMFIGNPTYFTRTIENGVFLIENIKNGHYRISAFRDGNSNLKCDMKSEAYGYFIDTLDLTYQHEDSIQLSIQSLDISDLSVQRKAPAGKYFEVRTNKYVTDYTLSYDTSYTEIFSNILPENKIIRFYNTFPDDSLQAFITLNDSIKSNLLDTLFIKFSETKRKSEQFRFDVDPSDKSKIFYLFNGLIEFSKPVKSINFDSLFFQIDSTTFSFFDSEKDLLFNYNKTELLISHLLDTNLFNKPIPKPDSTITNQSDSINIDEIPSDSTDVAEVDEPLKQKGPASKGMDLKGGARPKSAKSGFHLYLGHGAFISAENDSSQQKSLSYSFFKEEDLAVIKGIIETEKESFFIQLLTPNFELVEQISNIKEYEFLDIEPGDYLIRVLVDNNNNGIWEPGNYFLHEQNEDVYLYPEKITLRANWEITDINLLF